MTLGECFRKARERLGKRQKDIAEDLKKTQPTVNAWENDQSVPSFRDAKRVAWAYGISVEEMLACDMPPAAERVA